MDSEKETHSFPTHPLAVLDGVLYVPGGFARHDEAFRHGLEVDRVEAVFRDEGPLVQVGLVCPGSGDGFGHVVVALLPAI